MYFTGWTIPDGLRTLGAIDEKLSFAMPDHDITITANFVSPQDVPQTGDNTPIVLWTALCALSLVGISMLAVRRKKAK